ncbi:MAG TPA: hypothetical protein V6C72_19995, partial [Chroococcales cyanobacterium]
TNNNQIRVADPKTGEVTTLAIQGASRVESTQAQTTAQPLTHTNITAVPSGTRLLEQPAQTLKLNSKGKMTLILELPSGYHGLENDLPEPVVIQYGGRSLKVAMSEIKTHLEGSRVIMEIPYETVAAGKVVLKIGAGIKYTNDAATPDEKFTTLRFDTPIEVVEAKGNTDINLDVKMPD